MPTRSIVFRNGVKTMSDTVCTRVSITWCVWCRALLGFIAISYLVCVVVLSFMQKEDLDVGLLKRVQRRNADTNQLKIENVQNECFVKRSLDKASNAPTEVASLDENTAKELTRVLEKFNIESIIECLKHVKVTITTPSTTIESTSKDSSSFNELTVIAKDSFTNEAQNDLGTEKILANVFEVLDTNTDVTTKVATTETYKANRKANNNVKKFSKQRKVIPSVTKNKLETTKPNTFDIDDVDSKEIERMTKILNRHKYRKKNLPKTTRTIGKKTTIKPITKKITVDFKEDERLSKVFNGHKSTDLGSSTTIVPVITDDSIEKYRLTKRLAEFENIPKPSKRTINNTLEPIIVNTKPIKIDTDKIERLKRLNDILAALRNKHTKLLNIKSATTEPTTTDEFMEVTQLSRLIAELELKQDRIRKTETTTVGSTTMESTTTAESTDFEVIDRLNELLMDYELKQDHFETISTIKAPTENKKSKEMKHINEILAQYGYLKKTTTSFKPTTAVFTTVKSAEIERLRKLLEIYKNSQELLTKATSTTTAEPITVKLTMIDDFKDTERLRKLIAEYGFQELNNITSTSTVTTEPTIVIETTSSEDKELQRLKELIAKYEKREEIFTTKLVTIETTTLTKPTKSATSDSLDMGRLKKLLVTYEKTQELPTTRLITDTTQMAKPNDLTEIESLRKLLDTFVFHKSRQELLGSTTKDPITKQTTIVDSTKIERLKQFLDEYQLNKADASESVLVKPTTNYIEIERWGRLFDDYYMKKTSTTATVITKPTTVLNFGELERLSQLLDKFETQEKLKKIATTQATTIISTPFINVDVLRRFEKMLVEFKLKENRIKTTVAQTTINANKEIERLNKLVDEYRNRQKYLSEITRTTIAPITKTSLFEINPKIEPTTFKLNFKLTDKRIQDIVNRWINILKTNTPFEQTSSPLTVTTAKTITTPVNIRDYWRKINWYKPITHSYKYTTEAQNPLTTSNGTEKPNLNKIEMENFTELLSGLKNRRQMNRNKKTKTKGKTKIINKAVKRIEHYLKIIANRQELGSDIETNYTDVTDSEGEDHQTIEVIDKKQHSNNYIVRNTSINLSETTTTVNTIVKDTMENIYEPTTPYENIKYTSPAVKIHKTIINVQLPPSTDYRRENVYETTTKIENELAETIHKPIISCDKDKKKNMNVPSVALRDIAKNIREQIFNDLRKEIIARATTSITEAPQSKPVTTMVFPSEQDKGDDRQEATKAIVKFIKIIEQITATEKGTIATSSKTSYTANKSQGLPAPINILYQHTNLVPPSFKVPSLVECAKTYNLKVKNVVNEQDELKNRNNDFNIAMRTNENPIVLYPFPGEIPPLPPPKVSLSETAMIKNIISTTNPPESRNSDSPQHFDINNYIKSNRREELKKIRDSLATDPNTANIIDQLNKNKSNDNKKPLDEHTKHSLNYDILDVLNHKVQEGSKTEDTFKRYTHNVPLDIKSAQETDLKFRKFIRDRHTTQSSISSEFLNDITYHPIDIPRKGGIKGFHERLEGLDWPKDPNTMIDDLKQEESRASALQMTSRLQMPLSHVKKTFDDVSFRNFIQTQQRVNAILEQILASRARSVEAA